MFYNVGAGWTMSSYPGSWMIRPVLSMNEILLPVIDVNNKFNIYPNPVDSELFIETSNSSNIISIYSLEGVLIKQVVAFSNITKIDVNNLFSGIYIVEVFNDKGKKYQKIIVK